MPAVLATYLQHVLEPSRRHQCGTRAAALEERVGGDGGAMHHSGVRRHAEGVDAHRRGARGLSGGRTRLVDGERPIRHEDEIGERSACIDA